MPVDEPSDTPRMHSNALRAEAFVRLRDVDPRVVTPLLVELEDAGVAAYAEPPREGSDYVRHVDPRRIARDPLRVSLWVDRNREDVARAVVDGELPGLLAELSPSPEAQDAAFEAIVASFHEEPTAAVPPWPVHEDVDVSTRVEHEPDEWALSAPFPPPPAVDDEEHYVPPPPPPVPPAHPVTKYAITAMVLGFMLIIGGQQLLGFRATWGSAAFGVLVFVGGLATLIARMRDAPPIDDGPDDGAVV